MFKYNLHSCQRSPNATNIWEATCIAIWIPECRSTGVARVFVGGGHSALHQWCTRLKLSRQLGSGSAVSTPAGNRVNGSQNEIKIGKTIGEMTFGEVFVNGRWLHILPIH